DRGIRGRKDQERPASGAETAWRCGAGGAEVGVNLVSIVSFRRRGVKGPPIRLFTPESYICAVRWRKRKRGPPLFFVRCHWRSREYDHRRHRERAGRAALGGQHALPGGRGAAPRQQAGGGGR